MDFLDNIRHTIHILKNPDSLDDISRIPVLSGGREVAMLRPVPSVLEGDAEDDARLMAEWRDVHKTSFFSWIDATESSTASWLKQVYHSNDEEIIFMVETLEKIPFGHFSLYNFCQESRSCEFGRVVRGLSIGPNGGFTLSVKFLLWWAVSSFGLEKIILEVFEDNMKANALYSRCGFSVTGRIGLKKVVQSNGVYWRKIAEPTLIGEKPDGFALKMEIRDEQVLRYNIM